MNKDLSRWEGRPPPNLPPTDGAYIRVERAQFPKDGVTIYPAVGGAENSDLWTFIPIGPFEAPAAFGDHMAGACARLGWETYMLRALESGEALGMASYMRIRPEVGSAEVGCIVFSKKLQRTRAATEAMYLMARHVFDDLGYRRYEWKCDNANEPSKRAARRFGFTFEGVFRQDQVVKGRNRDTAWFSMVDSEWPAIKAGFETWLAPDNFDANGVQKRSLAELRKENQ